VSKIRGLTGQHSDPLTMFGAFKSKSAYDYFKPIGGDKAYDKLFDEAAIARNKDDRVKTVQALSAYLDKMSYFVPYAERKMIYWVKKGVVKEFGEQSQSFFLDLEEIKVNE